MTIRAFKYKDPEYPVGLFIGDMQKKLTLSGAKRLYRSLGGVLGHLKSIASMSEPCKSCEYNKGKKGCAVKVCKVAKAMPGLDIEKIHKRGRLTSAESKIIAELSAERKCCIYCGTVEGPFSPNCMILRICSNCYGQVYMNNDGNELDVLTAWWEETPTERKTS
jgi:hypothetical protein